MASRGLKVRDDLEYVEQQLDGDDYVLVHDPIRNTYFRYNSLQAAMLQALDGTRTPADIVAVLSEQFDVEIPAEAAERFIVRARDNMLLDIGAYETTSAAARSHVRVAMRKAGFRERSPDGAGPARALTNESMLFTEAFRQLELGHPRAAAGYLSSILKANPENRRARELYDLIQRAFIKSAGAMTDFPTFVLFNPRRLLMWLSHKFGGFLFSWRGTLAILAIIGIGAYAYTFIPFENIRHGVGPLEIAIAATVYTTGTFFHEIGHGLACQHYGGNVTEIGFTLFYYIKPAAYCDTSSSYLITNRMHKVAIQMAGTVTTLVFIASITVVLALLNPSTPIYNGLALELVIEAALAFVTLIPFMKADGYYAISDYFEFPNLRDRSFKLTRATLGRRILGLDLPTESFSSRTRFILITYAVMSFVFTAWFIYVAYFRMLAPLVETFGGSGLFAAILISAYLLRNLTVLPLLRGARGLWVERRTIFTARRSIVLAGLLAMLTLPWFIRWPVLVDATFVVQPQERAIVRATTPGRIEEIFVHEGDRVTRGQPLAQLRNPFLHAQLVSTEARHEELAHRLANARSGARDEDLAVAATRLAHRQTMRRNATRAAETADALVAADLGTSSAADALRLHAASTGAQAAAAQGALALLRAGTRPEDIQVAEAELARVAGELEHLRAEDALLLVRSPIDGVVTTPYLDTQLQVALKAGDVLAEVQDTSLVSAEILLAPSDPLGEIGVGAEVELRSVGLPGHGIRARVARVRDAGHGGHGVVLVTTAFALDRPRTGFTGHARVYGARRSLAYSNLYLPLQRLVRVRLWSI